jgi:spore coat protein U-like protein
MPCAIVKRLLVPLGTAILAAGAPSLAAGATASTTFGLTANVVTTCSITANNLNFGKYAGVQVNIATTLLATCSSGTPYTIGLSAGTTTGATISGRKLTGPGPETLNYGLFRDSAHTINWGNTPGVDTESGVGNGAAQSHTVFGQIPASQFVQAGAYFDTIRATLTF